MENIENNTVNKPTTIIREETINALVETINNSGLPAFVIVPILQDLLDQSKVIMRQQYEADLAKYNSEIEKEKINSEKDI